MRAFAEQNIFAPLGMKNTHFHDDHKEICQHRATGYSQRKNGGFDICMTNFDLVGDGGVLTTVEDLCLWDANFYNNSLGGYGQDLIEEITTPGNLRTGEVLNCAFGLFLTSYRGLPVVEHGGAFFGYQSQMMRFVEQRFSVICLSNQRGSNPSRLSKQVADIFLDGVFTATAQNRPPPSEPPFIELPSGYVETKVGCYRGVKSGRFWELTVQAEKLIVEVRESGECFQISPMQPNLFKASDGAAKSVIVEFEEHAPQSPSVMRVQVDGSNIDLLERIQASRMTSEELQEYAGDYDSEELGVTCRLLVKGDKIVICVAEITPRYLEPINRQMFKSDGWGCYEFTLDQQDRVVGFSISTGRVRGIEFVKQSRPERVRHGDINRFGSVAETHDGQSKLCN